MEVETFQAKLLAWFDQFGRKDLPWQHPRTPYKVWLSEIMLQQTQVATVIPYFLRFTREFPEVQQLALSSEERVLEFWSGLGYYARARNLHKSAKIINELGYFPDSFDQLIQLPGIGKSTAGAILSMGFNKSYPILDGNVKRVFTRYKGIHGWPSENKVAKQLWQISEHYTPKTRVSDYTQAIMDLGAIICVKKNPKCNLCPLNSSCVAYESQLFDQLPTPKPKQNKPIKELVFLILKSQSGEFYLEKRPSTGIWGGLWSLPEFSSVNEASLWCRQQHNLRHLDQQILDPQRHTFSHFHLQYTPFLVEISLPQYLIMEPDRSVWYKAEQIPQLALAAPIKKLLLQMQEK